MNSCQLNPHRAPPIVAIVTTPSVSGKLMLARVMPQPMRAASVVTSQRAEAAAVIPSQTADAASVIPSQTAEAASVIPFQTADAPELTASQASDAPSLMASPASLRQSPQVVGFQLHPSCPSFSTMLIGLPPPKA